MLGPRWRGPKPAIAGANHNVSNSETGTPNRGQGGKSGVDLLAAHFASEHGFLNHCAAAKFRGSTRNRKWRIWKMARSCSPLPFESSIPNITLSLTDPPLALAVRLISSRMCCLVIAVLKANRVRLDLKTVTTLKDRAKNGKWMRLAVQPPKK